MRSILRVAKTTVVLSVVFMLTVDTANACRLLQLLGSRRGDDCCVESVASAPADYGTPIVSTPIVSSAPVVFESAALPAISIPMATDVVYGSPVVNEVVDGGCCCNTCGDGIITSAPIFDGGFADSGFVDDGFVDSGFVDSGFVDGGIVDDGFVEGGYVDAVVAEPMIVEGGVVESQMTDSVFVPSADFSEGTIVEEGTVISTVEQTPTPEIDSTPIEEPTIAEPPADSPLDTDVAPPADTSNELFEPDTVAGEAPEADAPADDFVPADDFAADPAPIEDAAPVEDAGDDIFGGDNSVPDAPADAGGDDLFDAGADDAGGDDLFDAGADDAGGDDLFDAGADDVGGDDLFDAGADDAADDLFDDPGAADAGEPAGDDLDDVFGKSQKRPAGMRVWTDDTGKFKTVGRLVVIAKHHIRLLKSNGRHSTVPLNRLSSTDLDFVMVVAKRISDSKQVASL